jgi:hypothetical protein
MGDGGCRPGREGDETMYRLRIVSEPGLDASGRPVERGRTYTVECGTTLRELQVESAGAIEWYPGYDDLDLDAVKWEPIACRASEAEARRWVADNYAEGSYSLVAAA